jgi:hypothetical protein
MSRHVTLPSLSESIKMKAIRSSMVKGCFNEKKLAFRIVGSVKITVQFFTLITSAHFGVRDLTGGSRLAFMAMERDVLNQRWRRDATKNTSTRSGRLVIYAIISFRLLLHSLSPCDCFRLFTVLIGSLRELKRIVLCHFILLGFGDAASVFSVPYTTRFHLETALER